MLWACSLTSSVSKQRPLKTIFLFQQLLSTRCQTIQHLNSTYTSLRTSGKQNRFTAWLNNETAHIESKGRFHRLEVSWLWNWNWKTEPYLGHHRTLNPGNSPECPDFPFISASKYCPTTTKCIQSPRVLHPFPLLSPAADVRGCRNTSRAPFRHWF